MKCKCGLDCNVIMSSKDAKKMLEQLYKKQEDRIKELETRIKHLEDYLGKLTELTSTFGDALTKAGKDLNTIVNDAVGALSGAGGIDICSQIPNFESAGTEVLEKAQNSLQAQIPSIKEELSAIGDIDVASKLTDMQTEMETATNTAMAAWTSPASVFDSYSDPTMDA